MSGDVFKTLVMLFLTMSTWLTSYTIWVLQAKSHWRVCYCYMCSWRFCLFGCLVATQLLKPFRTLASYKA